MKPIEREMTADDWKALMLVRRLAQQVALHGKPAFDRFTASLPPREGGGTS